MPKISAVDTQTREKWVIEQYQQDPRISGPKMNKMLKKQFKATMRTTRIYELRDAVVKSLGWKKDDRGVPHPRSSETFQEVAHRASENVPVTVDPLLGRCVVPVNGLEEGAVFKEKLDFMNGKGFLEPKLHVEAMGSSYVIVAKS